jgi:ribosomal protein L5
METLKQKQAGAYEALKAQFGWKNRFASPRIQKVVVSVGTGSGMKRYHNTYRVALADLERCN